MRIEFKHVDDALARAVYLLKSQGPIAIDKLNQRIVDSIRPGMDKEKAVEMAALSVVVLATLLMNQEEAIVN